MRVPLSWLKTYIELPADLGGLFETCDMAGLEVAGVEMLGEGWDHIVVGRITAVQAIEGAHVQRVRVDTGDGERESACGAPNVDASSVGRHVVVALPGATVRATGPTGEVVSITVSTRTVKGFESSVVLCSEREVGLSDDHSGVLYLGDDTVVGRPLADALGDKVVEFELTPDLGRCFSIFGTARELSALTRTPLRPEALERADVGAVGGGAVPVRIDTPELCNRYLGAVIRDVAVGASPAWMQRRLLACGMRPINVVVDIANYVMIEMGQPLHFFDLAKLAGPEIAVRLAKDGEKMLALNGELLTLATDALVIADASGPVAVAGVIGGKDSAVSESTTDLLLEAAHFDYRSIRRTTQKLKLRTDAAERFIKDVDPEWTFEAMRRAVHLVLALVPGARLEGYRDAYPVHAEPITLAISAREVDRLLGMMLPESEIRSILEGFDFTVRETDGGLLATAPTWRKDVSVPADLIEEVARAIGMNNITPSLTAPVYLGQHPYASEGLLGASREIGAVLRGSGFTEAINYSIVSKAHNRFRSHYTLPDGVASVHLANPQSVERDAMRTTLLPGLLRNVSDNLRYTDGAHLYELGRAYFRMIEGVWEPNLLAAVSVGKRRGAFWGESQPGAAFGSELGLFDLLGVVQAVAAKLGVTLTTAPSPSEDLTAGKAMAVLLGDRIVGGLGEVGQEWLTTMDLEGKSVLALELHLDPLLEARPKDHFFHRLPTQPAVYRDLSVLVAKDVPVAEVLRTAREAAGDLLLDLRLFDRYEGEGVPEGSHSLAVSLTFQDPARTLQADEVQQKVDAVVAALVDKHGAQLRA